MSADDGALPNADPIKDSNTGTDPRMLSNVDSTANFHWPFYQRRDSIPPLVISRANVAIRRYEHTFLNPD
jgi:hypothetical protein